MHKLPSFGPRPASGFTLIELMAVVTVATILTVIAVPSYINTVRKSHRTEAKSILLDLAGRQERFMATNSVYSGLATDMGYTGAWPQNVGSNYYQISITGPTAAIAGTATTAAIPATFTFTATAINQQLKDTQCNTFTINQQGVQGSTNSAAAPSTGCW